MKSLFGEEIPDQAEKKQPPKTTVPKGYAAAPGTGPAGETCGTCRFHVIVRYANKYHKCEKMRMKWTGGAGSDIRVRSPACWFWKPMEVEAG